MYLLYLDDSGSASNVNDTHVVLAGVCVHESKLFYINKYLDDFAAEINPEAPASIEFHASAIWAGKEQPWDSIKSHTRREYIKKALHAVNHEARDTCLFATVIHKDSYPGRDPWELAFEDISSRFNLFLNRTYREKKERHKGLLILDETSYEQTFQELAQNFRVNGTRWGVTSNLQEVPLCVDSRSSRCIQLADHVAYAVYRRYQSGDLNYFNTIEAQFDSEGPRIHGLSHLTNNYGCTCPPCVSKKLIGASVAIASTGP